ncbi:hypothetical protein AIOL_003751 [Candidatus Rhodobacter oscarellae]|uniref:SnoaL-like domain-containing protein n=1 Tax=Candidatus Rhodobacter oscarellae TaxID=1675527 RepID=A0A0J9E7R8_9RHOB|nr:nuclear transport factor 2 family protein [Candidatus Rhodobacter lobularis]KMW58771.1 hypothetical protein AIOL_003751 [Candidatus Rhodobacter lobularis]
MPRMTRRIALLAGLALGAATMASAADTDAALTAFIEANNRYAPPNADPSAVAATYAGNAVVAHPMAELPGGPVHGADAILAMLKEIHGRYDTLEHVEARRLVSGDRAVWEGWVAATIRNDGPAFRIPFVLSLTFDADGRVTEQFTYVRPEQVREARQ